MNGIGLRKKGFALILAVFLLLTLAAIGTYLLTVSTGQTEAVSQDVQGSRAYQAARAGIEWGAYQVLQKSAGTFASNCAGGSASQTLTLAQGLSGYYAEVSCTSTGTEQEGASTLRTFRLTSTGCNVTPCSSAATPTYVNRQVQLTLTR